MGQTRHGGYAEDGYPDEDWSGGEDREEKMWWWFEREDAWGDDPTPTRTCGSTITGSEGTMITCAKPPGHAGKHGRGVAVWPVEYGEQDVDPDAPDDLILSHLVADVQQLRIKVRELSERLNDNAESLDGVAGYLGSRIDALEQAAAPVEDTQDGPPDRYAIKESGKPGYRTMVTDGGYPIAVCQKRADAERIAAALNAEPSAEVQTDSELLIEIDAVLGLEETYPVSELPDRVRAALVSPEVQAVVEAAPAIVRIMSAQDPQPWNGNAPGHAHSHKGRWDKDGSECEWCKAWFKFAAAVDRLIAKEATT
jgi:hypothetical protein